MLRVIKRFPKFLVEVKNELKKVNWSSREELVNATMIVIVAALLLTCYISAIDMLFSKVIQYYLK